MECEQCSMRCHAYFGTLKLDVPGIQDLPQHTWPFSTIDTSIAVFTEVCPAQAAIATQDMQGSGSSGRLLHHRTITMLANKLVAPNNASQHDSSWRPCPS